MTQFIRPEAQATLWRWRDALAGTGLIVLGAFGLNSLSSLMIGLSIAAIGVGIFLIINGIRRARFPSGQGGAGVVEVTERQITYLGPYGGGAVSLDELARIQIRTTADGPAAPDLFWMFTTRAGELLTIPGAAEGSDMLFDALAALKGVNYDAATTAAATTENQLFEIWHRADQKAALTP